MFKIKRFFRKLLKVFSVLPVIWKDEDWDFEYLLDLLKWKLSNMKRGFERYGIAEDSLKSAEEIKEVLHLIDVYLDPEEAFKEKYRRLSFSPTHVSVPVENGCSRLMDIDSSTGKPLTTEQEEELLSNIRNSYEFQQETWNKIWDLIKENGQRWWD